MGLRVVRLFLYVSTGVLRLSVGYNFYKMRQWMAYLIAFSLCSAAVLDFLVAVNLSNSMGLTSVPEWAYETMWTVGCVVNFVSAVAFEIFRHRHNGNGEHG